MISKSQQAELRKRARAANERIRTASENAQKAYEHYTEKYHTYKSKKGERLFKTGAAKTEAEYRQRMKELDAFLGSKYTTTGGWKKAVNKALQNANKKLDKMGYDVTEEELANVIKETGGAKKNPAAFYRALENLTAEKILNELDEDIEDEDFGEEIEDRLSDQQAAEALIKAREEQKKRTEKILRSLKRAGRKKNV